MNSRSLISASYVQKVIHMIDFNKRIKDQPSSAAIFGDNFP